MSFNPYGITIGPFDFRYYGIIITTGIVFATMLAGWLIKKMDKEMQDSDWIWDAMILITILGIIGARLYHVFTPSKALLDMGIDTAYYLENPMRILNMKAGGLGFPGAIIGGVIGVLIYTRVKKVSFSLLLDATAPGVALAQAIGRWGNFINQELYGPPTNLPWAIKIWPENRISGFEAYETFHPLFLYESIWNLLNAGFLLWIWHRYGERLKRGDIFFMYIVNYAIGRFALEFIRLDYVPMYGINLNQVLMLVMAIAGGIVLFLRHRKKTVMTEVDDEDLKVEPVS